MMWIILPIALILAFLLVLLYAALVVAGREDDAAQRLSEKREREDMNEVQ